MDDTARIYEDISWLPPAGEQDRGSGRARTLFGTAAVMAVAGAVGFGGAVLVHDSVTASTSTSSAATSSTSTSATTSSLTTTTAVASQATTSVPTTTSGGS